MLIPITNYPTGSAEHDPKTEPPRPQAVGDEADRQRGAAEGVQVLPHLAGARHRRRGRDKALQGQ